jgi:hypothetical protein
LDPGKVAARPHGVDDIRERLPGQLEREVEPGHDGSFPWSGRHYLELVPPPPT